MKPDFAKGNGLLPVIIQDHQSLEVLMLGFMNEEAYLKTVLEERVTFFSRSKNRLWTKGEESGHYLSVREIYEDCDRDTLLIKAHAEGPVCHTGSRNCFKTTYAQNFIFHLEDIIEQRFHEGHEKSYIRTLQEKGLRKMAQKVGEEAVETVIAALAEPQESFLSESADLLFHFMVLLHQKGSSLEEVAQVLKSRHETKTNFS